MAIVCKEPEPEPGTGDEAQPRNAWNCCNRKRWPLLIVALVLLAALVCCGILVGVLIWHASPATLQHESDSNTEKPLSGFNGKCRLIQRRDWLAEPTAAPLDPLAHPVPYVIISHSATEQCMLQSECTLQVRTLQTFHIQSKGWWDIGYNFLVGGDGYAYVGRGWDYVGAHAYGYNNKSIGINFIGTFNADVPNKKQMVAAKRLIEMGVELGKIAPNYKLLAHRQVSGTESPGKRFFEELKTWPHWAPVP